MDGPFQFLFSEPKYPQSRIINYVAQTELGIVNTLSRHLWWYQSIVWEDNIPSGSTIALSACDDISPSAAIRLYMQHSSHRIRILWWDNLAHAGFLVSNIAIQQLLDCISPFIPKKDIEPIPLPRNIKCKPPCPASFNHYDINLLEPTPLQSSSPPPLSYNFIPIFDEELGIYVLVPIKNFSNDTTILEYVYTPCPITCVSACCYKEYWKPDTTTIRRISRRDSENKTSIRASKFYRDSIDSTLRMTMGDNTNLQNPNAIGRCGTPPLPLHIYDCPPTPDLEGICSSIHCYRNSR